MADKQLTKEEIISFLKRDKIYLRKHFHITKIAIFGSFARDEQNSTSDIDLLIELEDNTQNLYELKNELKHYISKHFNRNVDIAREKYLKPYAKKIILDEAVSVE
jgi:uncharacterized protein